MVSLRFFCFPRALTVRVVGLAPIVRVLAAAAKSTLLSSVLDCRTTDCRTGGCPITQTSQSSPAHSFEGETGQYMPIAGMGKTRHRRPRNVARLYHARRRTPCAVEYAGWPGLGLRLEF